MSARNSNQPSFTRANEQEHNPYRNVMGDNQINASNPFLDQGREQVFPRVNTESNPFLDLAGLEIPINPETREDGEVSEITLNSQELVELTGQMSPERASTLRMLARYRIPVRRRAQSATTTHGERMTLSFGRPITDHLERNYRHLDNQSDEEEGRPIFPMTEDEASNLESAGSSFRSIQTEAPGQRTADYTRTRVQREANPSRTPRVEWAEGRLGDNAELYRGADEWHDRNFRLSQGGTSFIPINQMARGEHRLSGREPSARPASREVENLTSVENQARMEASTEQNIRELRPRVTSHRRSTGTDQVGQYPRGVPDQRPFSPSSMTRFSDLNFSDQSSYHQPPQTGLGPRRPTATEGWDVTPNQDMGRTGPYQIPLDNPGIGENWFQKALLDNKSTLYKFQGLPTEDIESWTFTFERYFNRNNIRDDLESRIGHRLSERSSIGNVPKL